MFRNARHKSKYLHFIFQCRGNHGLKRKVYAPHRVVPVKIENNFKGLKSLMRQGLLEPEFSGDLVYKLKKCVGSNNFSAQFIKIISHYKKIGYNINVLQQGACLVVNPITVGNFGFLFSCTPWVGLQTL